jgi:hypothetical protein
LRARPLARGGRHRQPSRWIARISPGRYALLAKLGPRWQWVEGARDDVLSSVPDADFEVATKIVLQRE